MNNPYGWFWEDDEEMMLPHAHHIVVCHDDGTDICVIVLRNEFMSQPDAVARVEKNAAQICKGLYLADIADEMSR